MTAARQGPLRRADRPALPSTLLAVVVGLLTLFLPVGAAGGQAGSAGRGKAAATGFPSAVSGKAGLSRGTPARGTGIPAALPRTVAPPGAGSVHPHQAPAAGRTDARESRTRAGGASGSAAAASDPNRYLLTGTAGHRAPPAGRTVPARGTDRAADRERGPPYPGSPPQS